MGRDLIRRLVLRSSESRIVNGLWVWLYRAAGRVGAAILTAGNGASAYARRWHGRDELVPGLSDIDLVVVGAGADSPRRRWRMALLAPLRLLVDEPRVHSERELEEISGQSALTYGLDDPPSGRRALYAGPEASIDRLRALERPGLGAPGAGWTLLRGPERRPAVGPPEGDRLLVAAWLELVWCWRLAFRACAAPSTSRAADICWKVLADAASVWLRLAGGEVPPDREAALAEAAKRLPGEEPALRGALELRAGLRRAPEPPLEPTIASLARISELAAAELASSIGPGGTTVTLEGGSVGAGGTMPLCDWRALACPPRPWERLRFETGGGVEVESVRRCLSGSAGEPTALATTSMLVVPGSGWVATRMRSVQFPFSDPVSFALADGRGEASYPAVRGWAAGDVAARAVAEHRARLRFDPDAAADPGWLLAAGRAALFERSLADGSPSLALTADATAVGLGDLDPADPAELRPEVESLLGG